LQSGLAADMRLEGSFLHQHQQLAQPAQTHHALNAALLFFWMVQSKGNLKAGFVFHSTSNFITRKITFFDSPYRELHVNFRALRVTVCSSARGKVQSPSVEYIAIIFCVSFYIIFQKYYLFLVFYK